MIKVINLCIAVKELGGCDYRQEQYNKAIINALVDELNVGIIDGTLNIFNVSKTLKMYDKLRNQP